MSKIQLAGRARSENERIEALDVARGYALLGIVVVHQAFAIPGFGNWNPDTDGGASILANLVAWGIVLTWFEGVSRTMFEMLFGAGFLMLLGRLEERLPGLQPADIFFRRAFGLVLLGFAHGYLLLWDSDFLYRYGIVAFFLFVIRKLSPRALIGVAVGSVALLSVTTYADWISEAAEGRSAYDNALAVQAAGGPLNAEQTEAIETWQETTALWKGDEDAVTEAIEERKKGYLDNLARVSELTFGQHTVEMYRWAFLDSLIGMTIGMALFKLGVMTFTAPRRVYTWMILGGYGIGLPVNLGETLVLANSNWDYNTFFDIIYTYDVGRLSLAIGNLGLIFLWASSGILKSVQTSFAAVGRMTLTNYLLKSVLFALTFYGFGLGLYGSLERYELYGVAALFCAIIIALSLFWTLRYRYGPVEWIWRCFTYWRIEPIRKNRAAISADGGRS